MEESNTTPSKAFIGTTVIIGTKIKLDGSPIII